MNSVIVLFINLLYICNLCLQPSVLFFIIFSLKLIQAYKCFFLHNILLYASDSGQNSSEQIPRTKNPGSKVLTTLPILNDQPSKPIRTKNLIIRKLNHSDLMDFHIFRLQPEVGKELFSGVPKNMEKSKNYLENIISDTDDLCLGIFLKDTEQFIGIIGAEIDKSTAPSPSVYYGLNEEH